MDWQGFDRLSSNSAGLTESSLDGLGRVPSMRAA